MNRKKAENLCLAIVTGLAILVLIMVLGTFGLSSVPGLFQLASGTLAAGWIVMFALANVKEDCSNDIKKESTYKTYRKRSPESKMHK